MSTHDLNSHTKKQLGSLDSQQRRVDTPCQTSWVHPIFLSSASSFPHSSRLGRYLFFLALGNGRKVLARFPSTLWLDRYWATDS